MTNPLFPCPSCSRHVRAGVARCPFCASATPSQPDGLVPAAPSGGLTRAALFAFATSVAACSSAQPAAPSTVAAQGEGTATGNGGGVVESPPVVADQGNVVPAYGLPPPPVTPDASPSVDAPVADATVDAPSPDVRPARPPRDPGAMMVRYGAPPPADFV